MLGLIRFLFPVFLVFLVCNIFSLFLGLLLHAYGHFLLGHKMVAVSGFCGKWLVRNCPYQMGDKCPCWTCPRAFDKRDPCPIYQAQVAAQKANRAERKAVRMAQKRP